MKFHKTNIFKKLDSGKRGYDTIEIVATLALILLFVVISIFVYKNLFAKSASGVSQQIDSAGDFDNDGVANFADKCPCEKGFIENYGCPSGYRITGKENADCLKIKT